MQDEETQDCPLCMKSSKFVLVDHGNFKHFFCPYCSEFQVSVNAEARIAASSPQRRAELSERARLGNDQEILVITLPSPSQPLEGFAGPSLVAEFVRRSKLCQ